MKLYDLRREEVMRKAREWYMKLKSNSLKELSNSTRHARAGSSKNKRVIRSDSFVYLFTNLMHCPWFLNGPNGARNFSKLPFLQSSFVIGGAEGMIAI